MAWPDIKKPNSVDVEHIREAYKTDYDTGAVETRPKFTKSRKKFVLGWGASGAMSLADLDSLQAAFDADLGTAFTWVDPDTDRSYTVVYSAGKITSKPIQVGSGFYSVNVSVEEP